MEKNKTFQFWNISKITTSNKETLLNRLYTLELQRESLREEMWCLIDKFERDENQLHIIRCTNEMERIDNELFLFD